MHKLIMTTAVLALTGQGALADVRGVVCDGCNASQTQRAATSATRQGTAYVFDREDGKVDKYTVFTEVIDTRPYTTWTQAIKQKTEKAVRNRFAAYVEASRVARETETIVLPPDFPVRSVAGALGDVGHSTTEIEDYLLSVGPLQMMYDITGSFLGKLIQLNLGLVDIEDIVQAIVYRIEFPDGSWQDYEVSFSLNPHTGKSRMELKPHGNAHTADGRAAPTSALGFRGRTFHDNEGSLFEWIAWARQLGLVVRGSGSWMRCTVQGNQIICEVRQQK